MSILQFILYISVFLLFHNKLMREYGTHCWIIGGLSILSIVLFMSVNFPFTLLNMGEEPWLLEVLFRLGLFLLSCFILLYWIYETFVMIVWAHCKNDKQVENVMLVIAGILGAIAYWMSKSLKQIKGED